jgi:hypothetical protein
MIDWPGLFTNTIWILALSVALAIVSTASWRASVEKTRLRDVLGRRNFYLPLLGLLVIFSLGLALSVPSVLEKLAWGALTVLSIVQFGLSLRQKEKL